MRISSFVIIVDRAASGVPDAHHPAGYVRVFSRSSPHATVSLLINPRGGGESEPRGGAQPVRFVLGDDQDAPRDGPPAFLGNGVVVSVADASGEMQVLSSISGLPAAFLYRDPTLTVLSSSIRDIAAVPGVVLRFDPDAVWDLANVGHPVRHRTLFERVSIIPAGTRMALRDGRDFVASGQWDAGDVTPFPRWEDYVDAQSSAMRAAVRRLDLTRSFLSLTAGLDTRAIFALLAERGASIQTVTMSGRGTTLDAMRAKQLSDAYGFPHRTVHIDDSYIRKLPEYAAEASILSGGLASLGQAFEVHLYNAIPKGFVGRVSGNLGNQIGRSGTEGTGLRNVNMNLLSPDIRRKRGSAQEGHWLQEALAGSATQSALFLIQNENLHASLGNYCVGNQFAVQQTPYADSVMIAQKLRQPPLPERGGSDSVWRIRLRDLRHRFLGQPIEFSFQRGIVRDVGGFAAIHPINWGWRARGGISPGGLLLGAVAIADVAVGSRLGRVRFANRVMSSLGILGFSSFQHNDVMQQPIVKEFVADTLLTAARSDAGVMDTAVLRTLVDQGISEAAHRRDVELALDLALAQNHFVR